MRFISTALKAVYLASYAIETVATGCNCTCTSVRGALAAAAAISVATAAASGVTVDLKVLVKDVEKVFVSDGSKQTYHNKLILFVNCLLDNHPEYLADGHKELLLGHLEHDKSDSSKSSRV
jgi:hypothetical protein